MPIDFKKCGIVMAVELVCRYNKVISVVAEPRPILSLSIGVMYKNADRTHTIISAPSAAMW